jgi:ligA
VRDFYRQAEEGTEVVVYGVDPAKTMTELLAKEEGAVRKLIERHSGALRAIFLSSSAGDSEEATEGLSPDVYTALPEAQVLADWATSELYAPLFIVIDGRGYTGKNLRDLSKQSYNRVGVLVGSTKQEDKGASLGILAGRIASIPVQRNAGRVRDGALKPETFYLNGKPIEEVQSEIIELYEKRYITFRRYVGRTGYFVADDNLATSPTDDYAQIANRRVIDKAYRLCYDSLLDLMLDELELNEDGTLQAPIIKAWEQKVEDAINRSMTASGELSSEDGEGCRCVIDPKQNVVATSKIELTLKVRPHGYARYIDVALGFLVTASETDKK